MRIKPPFLFQKEKADPIIGAYQSGLLDKKTAMYELKQLSDETGMFGSISDDDINAAAGVTWRDDTALKDPTAGIWGGGSIPFEDGLTIDYDPGQPRDEGGRWTSTGISGKIGKTKYAPSPQRDKSGIQLKPKTYARLTGILNTRYPGLQAGEIRKIRTARNQYTVKADGNGGFITLLVVKIK